jgi:uncharacterized membrane protein YphA (DoxX/SURF4 family)
LRRLFSTFADGWPGVGLLCLRLVAGAALIAQGLGGLRGGSPVEPLALDVLAIADGLLLIAGLWTPIAGSIVVILALLKTAAQPGNWQAYILLATMGVALALVGPGLWSVDARLFGWKRIDVRRG